ncbi:hypothetical protein P9112_005150 [Eukaryota sp. TZLM1-RC]
MTLIGTILDPRIKNNPSLLPVELQEVDADFSHLNRMIQSVSSTSQPTNVEAGTKQTVRKKELFNKVAAKKSNVTNLHVENELKCYLKEGIVDYETDPYLWWMENEKKYPSLAKIAKDYLVVQPSSASSERLFSAASQIISKKRARDFYTYSLVSMGVDDVLLFLQQWKVYSSVTPKKDLVPARLLLDPFSLESLVLTRPGVDSSDEVFLDHLRSSTSFPRTRNSTW